jgi:glycolate oxidase iron-sulfur subunit
LGRPDALSPAEPAAELGERKARNLLDTGAEAVVAANPGCALQITAHTERLGRALPVLHPMELLARSLVTGDGRSGTTRT